MPIDFAVALWCLAVPALLGVLGTAVVWWIKQPAEPLSTHTGADAQPDKTSGRYADGAAQVWLGLCVSLAALASLQSSVGVGALREFQSQAWCQVVWGMLVASLVVFTSRSAQTRFSSFWVASAVVAIATGYAIMPSGEGWSDTIPLHRHWLTVVSIAMIVNHWALRQLQTRGAHRWLGLVVLASLAGPTMLAAASYSALLHLCLAVSVTVGVIALARVMNLMKDLQGILLPTTLCACAMTASARFFSYDDPSALNYGAALFLPVIVDAVDRPLQGRPDWVRVTVAGVTCTAIALVLAYRVLSPTEPAW